MSLLIVLLCGFFENPDGGILPAYDKIKWALRRRDLRLQERADPPYALPQLPQIDLPEFLPEHSNGAARRPKISGKKLEQGGFSGPVGAHHHPVCGGLDFPVY
jgi:hypothetical protein